MRAHPSQGEGRAQKVVEPKPELAFGIAPGSQGGAASLARAHQVGYLSMLRNWCESDSSSHLARSVIEGRADLKFSSPEVR